MDLISAEDFAPPGQLLLTGPVELYSCLGPPYVSVTIGVVALPARRKKSEQTEHIPNNRVSSPGFLEAIVAKGA